MIFPANDCNSKRGSCPTCGKDLNHSDASVLPFCCSRCKQIDLGRWMNEAFGLPIEPEFDDEDPNYFDSGN